MSFALWSGRKFRTFNVINECNRVALCIEINTSLPAARVIRSLKELAEVRGAPLSIRMATALVDRLLHYAVVIPIEGNSYRLRENACLIPDHLRNRPLLHGEQLAETKHRRSRPRKEFPPS